MVGESDYDNAGFSVSGGGDVDCDGYADVVIGAPYEGSGEGHGSAYLVLGPASGTTRLAKADAKLEGAEDDDYAGFSVSVAGDVDGNGCADLLIGAWGTDTAYPWYGGT